MRGRRVKQRAALLAVGLAAGALLAGCSTHPPELLRVQAQQVLVNDPQRGPVYPALSLFAQVNDADGLEDLQELYLISDSQQLFWRLDAQTWTRVQQGSDNWVGSNQLALPDRRFLPAGEYRVLLMDLGGGQAEQTLYLNAPAEEPSAERFLPVTFTDGRIRIPGESGAGGAVTLWLYGPDGRFHSAREYRPEGVPIRDVAAADPELAAGFQVRAWRVLERDNLGQISGPWYYRP